MYSYSHIHLSNYIKKQKYIPKKKDNVFSKKVSNVRPQEITSHATVQTFCSLDLPVWLPLNKKIPEDSKGLTCTGCTGTEKKINTFFFKQLYTLLSLENYVFYRFFFWVTMFSYRFFFLDICLEYRILLVFFIDVLWYYHL